MLGRLAQWFRVITSDREFLRSIRRLENIVSKALSLAMVLVVVVSVVDLYLYLIRDLVEGNPGSFSVALVELLGLFLNVLIALEVLENITAYLREHVVQIELVIVTSLTAVARKIVIFDFSKNTSMELIGLAVGIFALSISYLIVRNSSSRSRS